MRSRTPYRTTCAAPLRAIDGYAQMLEEDYGAQLDDEGRRLISVVRASGDKMNRQIEDLLAFCASWAQTPRKAPVDNGSARARRAR
jgi:signal transduction histidine kinase